jgi:hypothetical protein
MTALIQSSPPPPPSSPSPLSNRHAGQRVPSSLTERRQKLAWVLLVELLSYQFGSKCRTCSSNNTSLGASLKLAHLQRSWAWLSTPLDQIRPWMIPLVMFVGFLCFQGRETYYPLSDGRCASCSCQLPPLPLPLPVLLPASRTSQIAPSTSLP